MTEYAFPRPIGHNGEPNHNYRRANDEQHGMTLRTYIATHVLAGRVANATINEGSEQKFAAVAVRLADALIAELNRSGR